MDKALSVVSSFNTAGESLLTTPEFMTSFRRNWFRNNMDNPNIVPKVGQNTLNRILKAKHGGESHMYERFEYFNVGTQLYEYQLNREKGTASFEAIGKLGNGKFFLEFPSDTKSMLDMNNVKPETATKPKETKKTQSPKLPKLPDMDAEKQSLDFSFKKKCK